jgi:DNA polymerase-3 subunit delta'
MFNPPDDKEAQVWLSKHKVPEPEKWLPFFGHAPLAVADAAASGRLKQLDAIVADLFRPQEPLAQAARWEAHVKAEEGLPMEDLVVTVQKWLHDLGHAANRVPPRYFPMKNNELASMAARVSLPLLLQAQRQVTQLRAWANHPLNPRLYLEDLCIRAFRPLGL